jgi:RimJ/RimL family protein N-acetyltransferase
MEPVLAANAAHLTPWIPRRVAEHADVDRLATRLEEFSAAFDANREWRYGLFDEGTSALLGEVSVFPRNASGRVALEAANEAEIGYWLREDVTGRGLATEAARAAVDLALTLPGIARLTIRCNERNAPSAAIPRRLGFRLAETTGDGIQTWEYRPSDAKSFQHVAPGAAK